MTQKTRAGSNPERGGASPPAEPVHATLFVSRKTPRSEFLALVLERYFERVYGSFGYELVVVDVSVDPQKAEDRKVFATPTLIRDRPLPERRLIGDVADETQVARLMDLPDGWVVPRGNKGFPQE